MSDDVASNRGREAEPKYLVGWQKLTKQEFVEALTVALVEKVRSLHSNPTEPQARIQVAGADSD